MSSPGWLSRYQSGQREQVWHELRQLGSRVREPELAQEAQLVCDEMARRARHNIEIIVARLSDDGYRFHTNDEAQAPVPHTYRRPRRRMPMRTGCSSGSAPCR